MKRILCIFLLACLALQLSAQVKQKKKPSTLFFHAFYNDFKTAQQIRASSLKDVLNKGKWSNIGEMQMGLGFNYLKGISKKMDAIATLDGSSTDYLFKNGTSNGSSRFLLDANAALNIKLLTDDHAAVPYLSGGAGFSLYQGNSGFYIPVGAGIQFNLFDEAFVLSNIQYRHALTSTVNDHFYYTVGIGAFIGKKKTKPAKPAEAITLPEPLKKEIIISSRNLLIAVRDESTGQPLASVDVVLSGPEGKRQSGSTNAGGTVLFNAVPAADYSVSGLLNHISSTVQTIKKEDFAASDSQITISLNHNDPQFTLSGLVFNKTKNLPEGGTDIRVTNETKNSLISTLSHESDGIFRVQLEPESDFTLVGKKAGYISNIGKISTRGLNRSTTLYVKLELGIEEAKVGQSLVLADIYFETGEANLNTSFSSDLDKLIQFLKDNPEARLEIQGHSDNVGSKLLNQKLSHARANSVVNYLAVNGINSSRLTAKGFGSSLPIAGNGTAEGRAKNRRVVMKVIR